jgi:hypothetical protein
MARRTRRPTPTSEVALSPVAVTCVACGHHLYRDYANYRTLTGLSGVTRYTLTIGRCHHRPCDLYHVPFRPEAEGRLALPHHEFTLEVLARVGHLRYAEHRSVPEVHVHLQGLGVVLAQRTVTNLLDRYDELLAVALADDDRLRKVLTDQKRVVVAIDGLQPDVGHEVLWVVRDVLSGHILAARSLLSARNADLAALLADVKENCPVPVLGLVSDGQHSIRKAIAAVFPGVPHQLCQFHYLREAARPIYDADRHAKKELKKKVRGVRDIERRVEGRTDASAEVIAGYCSAVRSALTDDGRPPLEASGLKLHDRLEAISESLGRSEKKGGRRRN